MFNFHILCVHVFFDINTFSPSRSRYDVVSLDLLLELSYKFRHVTKFNIHFVHDLSTVFEMNNLLGD